MKHQKQVISSAPLTSVLYSVMRGKQYSAAIGRDLGITQQAADLNLRKLLKEGFLNRKKEGLTAEYTINWKKIGSAWIEYCLEYNSELREYAQFRGVRQPQWEQLERFDYQLEEIEKLENKPYFIEFVEVYFKQAAMLFDAKTNAKLIDAFNDFEGVFTELKKEKTKFRKYFSKIGLLGMSKIRRIAIYQEWAYKISIHEKG